MGSPVFWISAYGVVALGSALLAGALAAVKNRDYGFWMPWCLVFPPLIIVLAALPRLDGPRPRRPTLEEEDRETW